jgi:glyoxylase-like metal-dependent hydrolase (beta-lactamase superfamily II)
MGDVSLSLHWSGACRHPERSTRKGGSWRSIDFPMFAAVIDRGGELTVFDPGYAPRFITATDPFPERLYRWVTPVRCPTEASLAARLAQGGDAARVTCVVVSHFHGDHVAGLPDFPEAEIVCSRSAWADFQSRRGLGAVISGYLKALVPTDLAPRVRFVEDLPARGLGGPLSPLGTAYDLFGDGAVRLVPLPGHSCGQIGALLRCADGATRFLIADAAWSVEGLERDEPPPWLVRQLVGRSRDYMLTWARLRAIAQADPELRLIPSHCAVAARREGVAGADEQRLFSDAFPLSLPAAPPQAEEQESPAASAGLHAPPLAGELSRECATEGGRRGRSDIGTE